MNLEKLLQTENADNVMLVTSVGDLKELFRTIVQEHDDERKKIEEREKESEIYLSQKDTADKLGISIPTLWTWEKKGAISKIKVGHKVRYRLSDVNKILNGQIFA